MKRLALLVSIAPILTGVARTAEPMNILMLFADDWRHDTMSAAGNPIVKTPRIDALAEQGVRFTHNCVTTSICGVSRATLYTGQWMSRHGCRGFSMFKTPWSETYPELLRKNGYHTGFVGKWHNGRLGNGKFDFEREAPKKHWISLKGNGKIHVTQKNEKDAMEFLTTRPKNKPFCLTVAFFATHAEDRNKKQYLPQPQSMSLYRDQAVPVPPNATEESWNRLPTFFTKKNEGRVRYHWRFDAPEKYQTMMKNYYRMATEVDTTCGRLLDELRRQGVLDNTLVIFTTDNGYFHGEHMLADKWYPHQESIRVPLVICDPRMNAAKRGTLNDEFTLNVDLAPTILAAAGVQAPVRMQGRDMSALYLGDREPAWRTEFFYEHETISNEGRIPASEALVRKGWKYMLWPKQNVEQLFNLVDDPREENDLIRNTDAAPVLAEMRQRFKELKAAAK
jgi:arylsulfatase A-like enzyme